MKAQGSHPEAPEKKSVPDGEQVPIQEDDIEEGALTASSMKEIMKTLRHDINADFKNDLRSGLEELREDVCDEMKTIRQETKNEFTKVRDENKIESAKTDNSFTKLEARLSVLESMPAKAGGDQTWDEQEGNPECLVAVSGFPWDTPEAILNAKLQGFIEENGLQGKVIDVFCYSGLASSGVLKFHSPGAQRIFLRSIRKFKGQSTRLRKSHEVG